MTLKTAKVAPVGRETVRGFGHTKDGTPLYEWEQDVFNDSPEGRALRERRIELGLGLREAAARLGITTVELGELERGRRTCDWKEAHARMGAVAGGDLSMADLVKADFDAYEAENGVAVRRADQAPAAVTIPPWDPHGIAARKPEPSAHVADMERAKEGGARMNDEKRLERRTIAKGSDAHVALWDAINRYVTTCRGDASKYVYGNTPRQRAVAEVEQAVERLLMDALEGGAR